MADVNLTITIPEKYISRTIDAFYGEANKSIELRDDAEHTIFKYLPRQEKETNQQFSERVIKELIVALVKCYELHAERVRYNEAVAKVNPPFVTVPDDIVTLLKEVENGRGIRL